MAILKAPQKLSIEKAKRLGKPYTQQLGRKPGKGTGHIKINGEIHTAESALKLLHDEVSRKDLRYDEKQKRAISLIKKITSDPDERRDLFKKMSYDHWKPKEVAVEMVTESWDYLDKYADEVYEKLPQKNKDAIDKYQGGLSLGIMVSEDMSGYVAGGHIFGYVGAYGRTRERDRIIERVMREQGLGPSAIGCWLTSGSGRHFMDGIDKDTIPQQFEKRAKEYTDHAFIDVLTWNYPDHTGFWGSSRNIQKKIVDEIVSKKFKFESYGKFYNWYSDLTGKYPEAEKNYADFPVEVDNVIYKGPAEVIRVLHPKI